MCGLANNVTEGAIYIGIVDDTRVKGIRLSRNQVHLSNDYKKLARSKSIHTYAVTLCTYLQQLLLFNIHRRIVFE